MDLFGEKCRDPDHSILLLKCLIMMEAHSYVATQDSNIVGLTMATTKKKVSRTLPADFLNSGVKQSALLKLRNDPQFCSREQENFDNW